MKGFNQLSCLFIAIITLISCATMPRHTADVTYFDGAMHTVKRGETLSDIAYAYEITPQLLRRVNNIEDPTSLRAGTRIFIPGASELRAVAVDQAMDNLAAASSVGQNQSRPQNRADGLYHTVQRGETLLAIAQAYDVSIRTLQQTNVIQNPSLIKEGQRLWIPGAKEVQDAQPEPVKIVSSQPLPEAEEKPNVDVEVQPEPTPEPEPEKEATPVEEFPREVKQFGEERFQWPIKDSFKVLRGYSETPGDKNPGIDLGAEIGTPVYAAANGEVKVVGGPSDPLGASLGNHVIVYHGERNNKGIYTIYAHNESISVEPGQKVKRGERLGSIGRSGRPAVGENGVLHFQVRELHKPVNPMTVLPPLK